MTKVTARKYRFTIEQLERIREQDLPALKESDGEAWCEAVMWIDDRGNYKRKRIREETEAEFARQHPPAPSPTPGPAPAPATPTQNVPLREDSRGCSIANAVRLDDAVFDGIRNGLKKYYLTSNELNERADDVNERLRELEGRLARFEKRLAAGEQRHDAHSKHLRNLETRITGVGAIEHSVKTKQEEERQ